MRLRQSVILSDSKMVEIGRLFWKRVVTSDDLTIGELESAELDMTNWQVTNFYVSLNDDASEKMGFDRPYFGKVFVCLPSNTVKEVGDVVTLNKTFAELMELRQCKK
jgi:sporulation protein YlmC with PRC-barrel domain